MSNGKKIKDELNYAGVDYDSTSNKYFMKHLPYETQPDLAGEGTPVSRDAARAMIDEYLVPLRQELNEAIQIAASGKGIDKLNEVLNKNIAATFGKETLLTILSQKDCEGIRFYMAKKPTTIEGADEFEGAGALTLVATGVTTKNGEIVDLGTSGSIISKQGSLDFNTYQGEVVPPTNGRKVLLEYLVKRDEQVSGLSKDIAVELHLQANLDILFQLLSLTR